MPEVRLQGDGLSPAQLEAEFQKIETARAELVDASPPAPEQAELILGKYHSVDDLVQAHRSLQAEYTRVKQGIAPKDDVTEPTEQAPINDAGEEPAETPEPEIDPEVFTALKDGLIESAGSTDKFNAIRDWANDNLPSDRKDYFNDLVAAGKPKEALIAFKSIQYDYLMQNGWEPPQVRGREPNAQVRGFRSEGEVKAAMRDPRYDSTSSRFDRAYHDDVTRKLAASTIFLPM